MLNSLRVQNIDIKTQRTTYVAGETVKGIFTLIANKSFKIHDISVSVYGKEKTNIVGITAGPVPAPNNGYKALHIFLIWEAPASELFSSIGAKQIDLYTLDVPAGIKQFPFEFVLPEDIPESYKGKSAWINYAIEAKVDMPNRLGLRKIQEITIDRPKKGNSAGDGHEGVNEGASGVGIPIGTSFKIPTTVRTPATKSFDDNVSSLSYHDVGLYQRLSKLLNSKQNKTSEIRLGLYKTIFSQGEKINGYIALAKITRPEKIRKVEIALRGMESATVDTEGSVNDALNVFMPVDLTRENKMEEYTKEIDVPKLEGDIIIPFDFQIPKQLKRRSYIGKYSKIY